ncbi:SDR family NAD(P)-dependent oxidoreductase [Blastomonas sp.]|uniref:SDR family NAD(P)-dependent oxidoreductase n=1 Tax=Blastomonas sp. TaxID=1909299 RepID=UPI003919B9A8
MEYAGKVIWITGASSGIGEALAEALAAQGASLILSGRRTDALQAVADRLPTPSMVLPFETTDKDALPQIVDQAIAWQGHVDGLVNNAGISQRALAIDSALEVYDRVIAVDLLAPIWLTQLLLPHMAGRKTGLIVGISSVAGRAGVPLRTAYCAAKHGLIGYLDALRAETEAHYGLKVHTVLPGSIRTQVSANALAADGSAHGKTDSAIANGMDPQDCAARILAGVAAGEREILVAEGMEEMLARLRFSDPQKLFDTLAAMGGQLAAQRDTELAG